MKSINIPISQHAFTYHLRTHLTGIINNLRLLSRENLSLTPSQKLCFEDAAFSGKELLKFANCLIEQASTVETPINITNCSNESQTSRWLSVLLIEDSPIIQQVTNEQLKSINCQVDIASNGYEALDILNKPHDIILLDINMPGMDGYETATKIRQQLKLNIPIVGFTSNPIDNVKEPCLLAGFNEVISKPIIDMNGLKNLLLRLVNK